MSKLSKILTLINLFTNRPMVSMKTIERVCQIPERTAYRYINDISSANFPVVYDKRLRAYRLFQRNRNQGLMLGADEIILLLAGLQLLSSGLHEGYHRDIDELKAKLVSSHEQPLEEILDAYESQLEKLAHINDCSEVVSSMLINTAIRGASRVKLTWKGERDKAKTTVLDQPSLNFKNRWRLIGTTNEGQIEIPIDRINKIALMR